MREYWTTELGNCLKEIRQEFEGQLEGMSASMEARYQSEVSRLPSSFIISVLFSAAQSVRFRQFRYKLLHPEHVVKQIQRYLRMIGEKFLVLRISRKPCLEVA